MLLPEQNNDDSAKYNATEKALAVLSYFAKNNKPIGTKELSEILNFKISTTSRVVNTLKKERYLEQDPLTRRYQLGPMIPSLYDSITQSLNNKTAFIAHPFCDSLRDQTSETVHFELLSGNNIFLAYIARSKNPITISVAVGDRVYPQIHAGAKCIAAYTHPRLANRWLEIPLPPAYQNTGISSAQLKQEYVEISRNGYAIDDGRHDKNIFSIAAPVFDNKGQAIASIVVISPYARKNELHNSTTINRIRLAAREISERLMCPQPYDEKCRLYMN